MASSLFFCVGQILFNLGCTFAMCHQKSFVPAFCKVSIDHLQLYLIMSGDLNDCFGNHLEKVLNFGSKNLYKPCTLL